MAFRKRIGAVDSMKSNSESTLSESNSSIRKEEIGIDMLERYTGTPPLELGNYILLTNFNKYLAKFSERYQSPIVSGSAFQCVTAKNEDISIIDFSIGSPTAALIMDLLSYRNPKPKGVIMLGMCGGLNKRLSVGEFILPIAAIRDDGASQHYMPPRVPALPTFNVQKVAAEVLVENKLRYRTGVIHTTDYRFWEFDEKFKEELIEERAIAIDMECATLFIAGFASKVAIGALMLVSDMPLTKHGIKTKKSASEVFSKFTELHLDLGIKSLQELKKRGDELDIRHYEW
ncbi:MAG: AMP nucleosidase [Chloroherpetonaceae bacterium]|nr:AMP nucleosidase [Chloroherpetonaceae bacterium]